MEEKEGETGRRRRRERERERETGGEREGTGKVEWERGEKLQLP